MDCFFFYTELGITYCVVGSHICSAAQNTYCIDFYDISRFFLFKSKSIIRVIIQDQLDNDSILKMPPFDNNGVKLLKEKGKAKCLIEIGSRDFSFINIIENIVTHKNGLINHLKIVYFKKLENLKKNDDWPIHEIPEEIKISSAESNNKSSNKIKKEYLKIINTFLYSHFIKIGGLFVSIMVFLFITKKNIWYIIYS